MVVLRAAGSRLDLDRRMMDRIFVREAAIDVVQEPVPRMTFGHYKVRGQGNIGRAHVPHMEVVHGRNPRRFTQFGFEPDNIYVRRHR